MLRCQSRIDSVIGGSIVDHHRVFHIGKSLVHCRFLIRVGNSRPVVGKPVEGMPGIPGHLVKISGRIIIGCLRGGSPAGRIVDNNTGGIPVIMIADAESNIGDIIGFPPPGIDLILCGYLLRFQVFRSGNMNDRIGNVGLLQSVFIFRLQYLLGI